MKRFLVVLFFPTDVLAHQAVVTTTDYESGSLSSTARACPSAPLLHPCVPNRPTAASSFPSAMSFASPAPSSVGTGPCACPYRLTDHRRHFKA